MNDGVDIILSQNVILYTWQQLLARAGISDKLLRTETGLELFGLPVYYSSPEAVTTNPGIIVVPCSAQSWNILLEKQPDSLHWLSNRESVPVGTRLPFENPVPVLFWGEGYDGGESPFAMLDADGRLVFHVDIIASSFFMLSRLEEIRPKMYDGHGRFPGSASVAYRQRFLDIPIVDQYAIFLREWLKVLKPDIQFAKANPKINLTHDIDWVFTFSDIVQFAQKIGGLLIKQKNLSETLNQFRELYFQFISPAQGEFYRSIYWLADLSERYGFISKFYFMAADHNKYQQGYDPTLSLIQSCLRDLRHRGHGIGFHPGYSTFQDPSQLVVEKERIEKALGESVSEGRQHYLRFRVFDTWRQWEQAGLQYDSTMGYADQEGFRCGTCHPYHPFDFERDREMTIWEIPLIVMDTSLFQYRKMSPEQGKDRVLELAYRCAEVGGTFTLLWHNTSFSGALQKWGATYPEILSGLSAIQGGNK